MAKQSLHELMKKYQQMNPYHNQKKEASNPSPKPNKVKMDRHIQKKAVDDFSKRIVLGNSRTNSVSISLEDAKKLLLHLPPKDRFRILGGKELNNLMDLYQELIIMEEDVFRHHVNEHRNDFADWIRDVLDYPHVSKRLMNKRDLESFKKTLADEIKTIEDQNKNKFRYLQPNYRFINKEGTSQIIPQTATNPEKQTAPEQKPMPSPKTTYEMLDMNKKHHSNGVNNSFVMDEIKKLISSGALEPKATTSKEKEQSDWLYTEVFNMIMNGFYDLKTDIIELSKKVQEIHDYQDTFIMKIAQRFESEHIKIQKELNDIKRIEQDVVKKAGKLFALEKDIDEKEKHILHRMDMLKRLKK